MSFMAPTVEREVQLLRERLGPSISDDGEICQAWPDSFGPDIGVDRWVLNEPIGESASAQDLSETRAEPSPTVEWASEGICVGQMRSSRRGSCSSATTLLPSLSSS